MECPILKAGLYASGDPVAGNSPAPCRSERCALWEETLGMCSFKVSAHLQALAVDKREHLAQHADGRQEQQ